MFLKKIEARGEVLVVAMCVVVLTGWEAADAALRFAVANPSAIIRMLRVIAALQNHYNL